MRNFLLPALFTLVGCMPGHISDTPSRGIVQDGTLGLPPLKSFTTTVQQAPMRANSGAAATASPALDPGLGLGAWGLPLLQRLARAAGLVKRTSPEVAAPLPPEGLLRGR